jgi:monoamine oxidase
VTGKNVIIVGAGIAGLTAACDLVRAGWKVTVLEARDRPGGRILTVAGVATSAPIELGAEFIHGGKVQTWQFLRRARLQTDEVPDRHWELRQGRLWEMTEQYDFLDEVIEEIQSQPVDQSMDNYVRRTKTLPPDAPELLREYVEGFHAADFSQMSALAFASSEVIAEEQDGAGQYRVRPGYGALVDWFWRRLESKEAEWAQVHFQTVAERVRWRPGGVEVWAKRGRNRHEIQADALIVTVPISLLGNKRAGSLHFDPPVPGLAQALSGFGMGYVAKLVLEFKQRFWPVENFGFIHTPEEPFPTWWADKRGLILTAWVGGPRAEQLRRLGAARLRQLAVGSLSNLFQLSGSVLKKVLTRVHYHNWSTDPFSQGAYSYLKPGGLHGPERLATPIAGTIFFAGEATASAGHQGTVHGAIESGARAAANLRDSGKFV